MSVRLDHTKGTFSVMYSWSSFSLLYSIHGMKYHNLSILWCMWTSKLFLAWNYYKKSFPMNLHVHGSLCTYTHISPEYIPWEWLLGHKVWVCSALVDYFKQFSKVIVPIHTPSRSVYASSSCFTSLPKLYLALRIICLFSISHFDGWLAINHCSFNFFLDW